VTVAQSAEGLSEAEGVSESDTGGFRFCLNMSTLRGHKLDLVQEIEIAAQAGYTGIEPWIREIETYADAGGDLADLRKRIADAGLTVESAIGFSRWIVDDEAERADGLEQAKRDMDLVRQVGGSRIAAPPSGATNTPGLDLFAAAERYRALLDAGRDIGVVPQLEVWGFSQNLARLGEAVLVAIESGHPDACLLPDVYHVFRGGSDFTGLSLLSPRALHVFHINDYPAEPPRAEMKDSDRVYPGDGVAPLDAIVQMLHRNGIHCAWSLELFNPEYWKQDPLTVARTGLEKSRSAVQRALAR
jgi:sugar phosphate isomerase/epimerase